MFQKESKRKVFNAIRVMKNVVLDYRALVDTGFE